MTSDDGLVLAESGAIVETLIERWGNGRLAPAVGTLEHLRYRYWLHFAEGSAMLPLLLKLVFDTVEAAKLPFFIKPMVRGVAAKVRAAVIDPNLKAQLDFMEGELAQRDWFAGDHFTGADVQMSFSVEAAAAHGGLDVSRPRLMG